MFHAYSQIFIIQLVPNKYLGGVCIINLIDEIPNSTQMMVKP